VFGVGYTLVLVNPDLHQYDGLHLSLTKLTIKIVGQAILRIIDMLFGDWEKVGESIL
jgi:hypothetical protein